MSNQDSIQRFNDFQEKVYAFVKAYLDNKAIYVANIGVSVDPDTLKLSFSAKYELEDDWYPIHFLTHMENGVEVPDVDFIYDFANYYC